MNNKTKKCKYCQSEIDAKAKICPNCGKKQGSKKALIFIIAVIVLFAIIGSLGNKTDNGSSTGSDTATTENADTSTGNTSQEETSQQGTDETQKDEPKATPSPTTPAPTLAPTTAAEKAAKEQAEAEQKATAESAATSIVRENIIGKSDKNIDNVDSRFSVSDVRNDKTGKWRISKISANMQVQDYALSYYKKYFENDNEVHWIVNFANKTTNCITYMNGNIFVDVHEYVDKEEHYADTLGGGMTLARFTIYTDNGDIEQTK